MCNKILEKSPSYQEAMALKGLAILGLNDKTGGEKLIKDSLKLGYKNATCWHFYAIFNKENKNYAQAAKCYIQANKNDPENFNVIRDLSYLQLYLGQFEDFNKSTKKSIDVKNTLVVNWITYSFSQYLLGDFNNSLEIIKMVENIDKEKIKKQELTQINLFKADLLDKLNKNDEAIKLLIDNNNDCVDKMLWNEAIVKNAIKIKNKEIGIEYLKKCFENNNENINYFIWYFNLKLDLNMKNYDDLFKEKNEENIKKMKEILINEIKPLLKKSKIFERLEISLSLGEEFKEIFNNYFIKNIKKCLPSFFINVKFIYLFQLNKIPIIEEILNKHLESINKNKCLDLNLMNNEKFDFPSYFSQFYFYVAQHYLILGDAEKALKFINLSIDITPTIVELYLVKSKILKHCLYLNENVDCLEKAKNIDLSDRYLNAKHAKSLLRVENVEKSEEVMKEFVKEPLLEENCEKYENMWYQTEVGKAYLKKGKILFSHKMFRGIYVNFNQMYEDQSDFYNYSLRRYILNDFYKIILYMNRICENKFLINALFYFDLIREMIIKQKEINSNDLNKKLTDEFNEMKEKFNLKNYKFSNVDDLISLIENDIFEICKKVQKICFDSNVHLICVKYFLLKNKIIMALKSLKFLEKNDENSFYYYESFKLFNNYLKNNNNIETEIKEILAKNSLKKIENFEEKDEIKKLFFDLYEKNSFCNEKENNDLINNFIEKIDNKTLLKQSSSKINDLLVFITVFSNVEKKEEIFKKLQEKLKIKNADYEKEIKGNLTLWQKKEEAEKLFPGTQEKNENEEDE